MACQIKNFHLIHFSQEFHYLKWCPSFFPIFMSQDFLVKAMQSFLLSLHRAQIQPRVGWCSAYSSTEGASLLRLTHRSIFYRRLLKHPACTLQVPRCVQSTRHPLQRWPYNYSHQHQQLYYLLASFQWEIWATSNWDRRRIWMSQFWFS